VAPISNSDIHNVVKGCCERNQPDLTVHLFFFIKGCSENVVPVLKFIIYLSLPQNTFPNLWKQAAILLVSNKIKFHLLEIIGLQLYSTNFLHFLNLSYITTSWNLNWTLPSIDLSNLNLLLPTQSLFSTLLSLWSLHKVKLTPLFWF
jgi:hypothetical protein